jgi:hypothetical protein
MTHPTPLETRVAALISAYADRVATDVDPIAMTRIAVGPRYGNPPWLPFRPVGLWLGFAVVVMGLLITIVAGVLAAGGQLLRRDPLSDGDPGSVIAHYGKIHVGYVYVYADGLVVMLPDIGATPVGAIRYSLAERRLTREGVDLVRSGAIDPSAILTKRLPDSAWAEPEFRPYAPSSYAICDWTENYPMDPSRVGSRVPAPVQALLRGKERTYDQAMIFTKIDAGLGEWPPVVCSEVTADEAHILVNLLEDAGFETDWNGPERTLLEPGADRGYMRRSARSGAATEADVQNRMKEMHLGFDPILPHGTWVDWGG